MKTLNPDYPDTVRQIFERAAFIVDVGIQLGAIEVGAYESTLAILPRHLQQHQFVHAGVLATMADHTAGAAAGTLIEAGNSVLTVEFKINLLRPAIGESLRCRATVLRGGRTLSVVESEVFARHDGTETLVSKSTVTLAIVPETPRR